ncbi:ninjurin-1-like isoform X2 [Corticium candelabrum]|uniref:ninjurin-1-like isoform X2 n=1 Tax=Corticium candelabrum TaxID=121492 RepID=UPI002E27448A|nr:ninjurin-1-like isoform X2 [Corticium candelabrum]
MSSKSEDSRLKSSGSSSTQSEPGEQNQDGADEHERFHLKSFTQDTQWIKSVLNATAFSQNLSLLLTIIKDGNGHTFYYPLIVMATIALTLQVIVALFIVWISTAPPCDKQKACTNLQWSNRILMMLSTLSLMLNVAVNVFFAARAGAPVVAPGGQAGGNGQHGEL